MTPEECRELAAELPEDSGIRRALLLDADRQERGDTSPVVFEYVRGDRSRGACFDMLDGIGGVRLVCTLLAGHAGAHEADDGARWMHRA